jgi:hypothetical protein
LFTDVVSDLVIFLCKADKNSKADTYVDKRRFVPESGSYIKLLEDPAILVTICPLPDNNHSSAVQRAWEFILDIGGNTSTSTTIYVVPL